MSKFHLRRPSGAMVVASLALFVALGSGAYAATSINGKKIKNGTIAGSKLKQNTLTGAQIDESQLGTVPHATVADHVTQVEPSANATNAEELGGQPAGSYVRNIHRVTKKTASDSQDHKTVTAFCPNGEIALGGGGNNTASTGNVTFDRLQLEDHSFTVTEFEVVPTAEAWTAEAEVTCAIP